MCISVGMSVDRLLRFVIGLWCILYVRCVLSVCYDDMLNVVIVKLLMLWWWFLNVWILMFSG